MRRDYSGDVLPQDLASFEPWKFFTRWMDDAIAAEEVEPNAMLLATIGLDGRPRSRVVLLKDASTPRPKVRSWLPIRLLPQRSGGLC